MPPTFAIGDIGVYIILFLAMYFEVFLFISFLEHRPKEKTARRPKLYPSVTIVVPCFNEEKTLAGTIESLLAMEYPKDKLAIMVVDDGSLDSTLAVANTFRDNPQVEVIHKKNGGKYTALNLGIERSKADIIGCLDADSFVAPDALIESVKRFEENSDIMAVVPAMKVQSPHNLLELMQAVEYTFGIFYKKMFDNLAAISVLPGPFSLYRREVFEKVGMFRHAHNTEDMEMAWRMHAHHLLIANAHTAIVYTKVPNTVRALIKQRTRWSQGFLDNSKDYRHMYFNARFGNFGLLILPFGLSMFLGALYVWGYTIWNVLYWTARRAWLAWSSQIPPHTPSFGLHFDWFYVDTGLLSSLAVVSLCATLTAILIGRRIAGANFGFGSLAAYFTLYGFLAPLWLARAAWGSIRSKESVWRENGVH